MTDQFASPEHQMGPPHTPASKEDWILQQLNNHTRELGQLSSSIINMEKNLSAMVTEQKEMRKALDRILYIIAFATGAIVIIGYLINSRFDQIMTLLAKGI